MSELVPSKRGRGRPKTSIHPAKEDIPVKKEIYCPRKKGEKKLTPMQVRDILNADEVAETMLPNMRGENPLSAEEQHRQNIMVVETMNKMIEGESRLNILNELCKKNKITITKAKAIQGRANKLLRNLNPKDMDDWQNIFFARFEELYHIALKTDLNLAFKILESEGKFYGVQNPKTKHVQHVGKVTVELDMGLIGKEEEEDYDEFEDITDINELTDGTPTDKQDNNKGKRD